MRTEAFSAHCSRFVFGFFLSTMSASTTPPPPAYVRRVDFPRLCQHYRPCREAGILECRSCHKYMCDLHINTRIYGDGAPSPAYIDRSFTAMSVFHSLHPYLSLSTYLSLALVDVYKSIYIYGCSPVSTSLSFALYISISRSV